MSAFSRIGVIAKRRDEQVLPAVRELCQIVAEMGCAVRVESHLATSANHGPAEVLETEALIAWADLLIVVGGDGTLLRAGRNLAQRDTPVLGIHHGRLGFLVDVRPDQTRVSLQNILAGDYWIENRLTLNATIHGGESLRGPYPAINDVVIRNQAAVRMLEFETWLGEEFISLHRADGFIVATPTGSTAYALSGGGPVLHPSIDAVALVPICPHTLSDRPLVVSAERPVFVALAGDTNDKAMMTCDGQTYHTLSVGERLQISRSEHPLRLIHPRQYDYFHILRNKMHWGRDKVSNGA